MGLFGGIIGGALGVGGSIFGGISASNAMRKARNMVKQDMRDNQNWYDRRYNEDSTQRADAQRIMTAMQEQLRNRARGTAGAMAVMGGTNEAAALDKAAANQALADATSQIAAAGERRKDSIEQQYMQRKDDLRQQLRNLEIGRANAVTQAVGGIADAGATLGGAFDKPVAGEV